MRAAAERAGIEVVVDSAATGSWHVGNPPDERSIAVAAKEGIDISGCRSRQVRGEDFRSFDYILALDPQNLRDLRKIAPGDTSARVGLLLDFVEGRAGQGVSDPYYQDDIAFELVWRDVNLAAEALVAEIAR
jgi:protein-tyrosine phosphatase